MAEQLSLAEPGNGSTFEHVKDLPGARRHRAYTDRELVEKAKALYREVEWRSNTRSAFDRLAGTGRRDAREGPYERELRRRCAETGGVT